MLSSLALRGLQAHATSLILTEAQSRRHPGTTIFKCHRWAQIIDATVEPSCPVREIDLKAGAPVILN